jgi:hypothetical protein
LRKQVPEMASFRLQWNRRPYLLSATLVAPLRLCALLLLAACRREEAPPPLRSLAPAPLAPLRPAAPADAGREAVYQVEAAPVWGDAPPSPSRRVLLEGATARLGTTAFGVESAEGRAGVLAAVGRGPVVLVPVSDTYLAQVSPLLAALDDAAVETWLLHPSEKVAFRLRLRDGPAFDAWLHEPRPGALRMVQRQDGLELVSNVGKLPGGDANGPTVPRRGGQLDVALAREGLERLKSRFGTADTLCVVPSFGTELRETGAVLTAAWAAPTKPLFTSLCLVYPRPPGWRPAPGPR